MQITSLHLAAYFGEVYIEGSVLLDLLFGSVNMKDHHAKGFPNGLLKGSDPTALIVGALCKNVPVHMFQPLDNWFNHQRKRKASDGIVY